MPETRERWGGRLAFIMAAIGSAVGLGNVWRFPYTAFKNGGGAFLIPYFVALLTAGIPIMIVEYALGQRYQRGAPDALARTRPWFRWVGWFAVLVGLTITFYYVAIMGVAWYYLFASPSLAWTKPVPVISVDKARPDWVNAVPAERVVLYHRCKSAKERARLTAIEESKPAGRRMGIYTDAELERLVAGEASRPESQRKHYVSLDDNIAHFFKEKALGGFRPAIWTAKARHNMAIEFARRISKAAGDLRLGGGEALRVDDFLKACGDQDKHKELVADLARRHGRASCA